MPARFAWTNDQGFVSVTTCADGVDPVAEAAELQRRGQIPVGAEIVFDPALPAAPHHQWVITAGRVVVNPARPEPFDKRKDLKARAGAVNSVAELRQIIQEMLE